jgi:hypothetical protein
MFFLPALILDTFLSMLEATVSTPDVFRDEFDDCVVGSQFDIVRAVNLMNSFPPRSYRPPAAS